MEGDLTDRVCVAGELVEVRAGSDVIHVRRPVLGAGGQEARTRTDGDPARMATIHVAFIATHTPDGGEMK